MEGEISNNSSSLIVRDLPVSKAGTGHNRQPAASGQLSLPCRCPTSRVDYSLPRYKGRYQRVSGRWQIGLLL